MTTPGQASLLALISGIALVQDASHQGLVTDLAWWGSDLVSCSQAGVFRGEGETLRRLCRPDLRVNSLAMIDDGALLLGGGEPGKSGLLCRAFRDGTLAPPVRVADDLVYDVAVQAGGKLAACACADGRVLLLDLPELTNARLALRHTAPARAVAFSPDGTRLASCGLDRLVQLVALEAGAKPVVFEDHTGAVECLAFSADGALLASGARDGKLRLHAAQGRLVRTWQDLGEPVRALAWRPGGSEVVAALADGRVLAFPAAGGEPRKLVAAGQRAFAVLAAEKRIVVGADTVRTVPER